MDFNLLLDAFVNISKGVPVTIGLVVISGLVGLVVAILINIGKKYKILRLILNAYVIVFIGTPLFLQIFFFYYGLGGLLGKLSIFQEGFLGNLFRTSFVYALITMACNTGAYGSIIIKTALDNIPNGQKEAAKALGLSKWQTFKSILFPQAFYYALPAYSNEVILLVKSSSLASVITIMDITGYMQRFYSATYSFYEPFFIAAVYYLLINLSIIFLVKKLEKRASGWLHHNSIKM